MAQNFFDRLRSYYIKVAEVLRGEADAASVFANTTDIGMSRELAYAEFLKQHAPSKCNVLLGGFLFDDDGTESKQLDIIITTDTAPRFNFHNKDGAGKSFSPVEGTLGVVSVKSTLNRAELFDALGGIASIPPTRALDGRVNVLLKIKNYDDWPVKIVYASKGIAPDTLLAHINDYYVAHPEIPVSRRPNFIHVAGSCLIIRAQDGMTLHDRGTGAAEPLTLGTYHLLTTDSDLQAIVWTLNQLQRMQPCLRTYSFRMALSSTKSAVCPNPAVERTCAKSRAGRSLLRSPTLSATYDKNFPFYEKSDRFIQRRKTANVRSAICARA